MAGTQAQTPFDSDVGQSAFAKHRPQMEQLAGDAVIPANAKVNLAAAFVIGLRQQLEEPSLCDQILRKT